MNKTLLAVAILIMATIPSFAQDWVETSSGAAAYDCALIGLMAADLGARAIARVDDDLHSIRDFFAIFVPDCIPDVDPHPASLSEDYATEWTPSAMHETEYDCASLVPDCIPEVDTRELISRIGNDEGWAEGSNSYYEFNCDYFGVVVAEYGELDYLQSGENTYTLEEYYLMIAPLCKARNGLSSKALDEPQESAWIKDSAGDSSINCPLVKRLLSEYGVQDYIRGGGEVWSNITYYQNIFSACIPSNVITSDAVTLLDCAEASCDSTDSVSSDTVLEIVGIDGPWYEVKFADATAFVPIKQTFKGGYPILQPFDGHEFEEHTCFIWIEYEQHRSMKFDVFDLSEGRRDAIVDIYHPIDEIGIYAIEVTLGETSGRVGLEVRAPGNYSIYLGGC